MVQVAFGSAGI